MTTKSRFIKHLPILVAAFAMGLGVFNLVNNNKVNKQVEETNASSSSYWDSWVSANSGLISTGGTEFVTALKTKITQAKDGNDNTVSYNGLWTAFKTSDPVPGSENLTKPKIWDMYGGFQFTWSDDQAGSYSKEGDVYNREHSVPKSWFSEHTPAYSDLVHLVPTDGKVNGMRSNYAFGEVQSTSVSGGYSYSFDARSYNGVQYQSAGISKLGSPKAINGVTTNQNLVFEPDDQYKGDFARIYMYFAVRYGGGTCAATTGAGGAIFSNTLTDANPYVTDYGKALLMKWHNQDPVSTKETNRNNAIESLQGNRNPFVDYPEWASKIFGSSSSSTDPTASISPTSLSVEIGGNGSLTATLSNVTNSSLISWTSSDESVATVTKGTTNTTSSVATVSGVAAGTATIYCRYNNSNIGSVSITVASSGGGQGGDSAIGSVTASSGSFSGWTASGTGSAYNDGSVKFDSSGDNIYKLDIFSGNVSQNMTSLTVTLNGKINGTPTATNSYKVEALDSSGNVLASDVKTGASIFTTNYGDVVFTISSGLQGCTGIKITYVTKGGGNLGLMTITWSASYSSGGEEVTLSAISVETSPTKTIYVVGEYFDPTGLVITRTYSDESSDTYSYAGHTTEFTFSPSTSTALTVSNTFVTIGYGGKSCPQPITVNKPAITGITATVNKTFYVGETITKSNITVKDSNDDNILDFSFTNNNYRFTYEDAMSGGSLTNKIFSNSVSSGNFSCSLSVQVQRKAFVEPTTAVIDTLTRETTGIASNSTTYSSWSNKSGNSGAVYAGQSAGGNNSIQLRSNNNNSGIIQTSSGGNPTKVDVVWQANTDDSRILEIYGKNSAYASPSDLYDSNKQGTLIGSITKSSGTSLTISGSYAYIGMRSSSGALYLTSVSISYSGSSVDAMNLANYIMFTDTENQCTTKFDIAVGYLGDMSSDEISLFGSSTDYVISTARRRLNAWASHQGKVVHYNDGSVTNASPRFVFNSPENNNAVTIIVIISLLGITSIGVCLYIHKRKSI